MPEKHLHNHCFRYKSLRTARDKLIDWMARRVVVNPLIYIRYEEPFFYLDVVYLK